MRDRQPTVDKALASARLWRAIAMGLLIALTWQVGNAALTPRRVVDSAPVEHVVMLPPAVAAQATPLPTASVEPTPAPEPSSPVATAVIAGTGGIGVFLRATPRMADRLRAWPDGTVMQVLGGETQAEGRTWLPVAAPDGAHGWLPAEYLRR